MFIDSIRFSDCSSLQRSEIYGPTRSTYQYIALRRSAKQWLATKSINVWLLRSQNIVPSNTDFNSPCNANDNRIFRDPGIEVDSCLRVKERSVRIQSGDCGGHHR